MTLPRGFRSDPPHVRKAAWVVVAAHRGDAWFAGLSVPVAYRAVDSARCSAERCPGGEDDVPHLDGTCGFHGAAREALAWMMPEAALLDVELFGRVVRHQRGWRASRQRVLGVQFVSGCVECCQPDPRPVLVVLPASHGGGRGVVVPRCSRCAHVWRTAATGDPLTPGDLAGMLGTEVSWAPPSLTPAVLFRAVHRRPPRHWRDTVTAGAPAPG